MKILGLDCSSKSTGWGLIDSQELIEYGKINPTDVVLHCQKLNLIYIEINKLLSHYKPDHISIEETVYVKNSKAFRVLSRIQAIALLASYQYLRKEPVLYEPSHWKKELEGCKGNSKKCEIQLSICRIYSLVECERIKYYENKISEVNQLKYNKKQKKKKYDNISIEIYAETGINSDISDAIGVARALEKELLK